MGDFVVAITGSKLNKYKTKKKRRPFMELTNTMQSKMAPGTAMDMTLNELQQMADRQEQQIQNQQQQLVAKEQRLKYLKQQELLHQKQQNESDERQCQLQRIETLEQKLYRIRGLKREHVESISSNEKLQDELDRMKSIFREKEKEFMEAVEKVEKLTSQLELIKSRNAEEYTKDIERLRRELSLRNKLNEQNNAKLATKRHELSSKMTEKAFLDRRISEMQDRLNRKKKQYAERTKTNNNNNNDNEKQTSKLPQSQAPPISPPVPTNVATIEPIMKTDLKYQTLPHSMKFASPFQPPKTSTPISNRQRTNSQPPPLQDQQQQLQQQQKKQQKPHLPPPPPPPPTAPRYRSPRQDKDLIPLTAADPPSPASTQSSQTSSGYVSEQTKKDEGLGNCLDGGSNGLKQQQPLSTSTTNRFAPRAVLANAYMKKLKCQNLLSYKENTDKLYNEFDNVFTSKSPSSSPLLSSSSNNFYDSPTQTSPISTKVIISGSTNGGGVDDLSQENEINISAHLLDGQFKHSPARRRRTFSDTTPSSGDEQIPNEGEPDMVINLASLSSTTLSEQQHQQPKTKIFHSSNNRKRKSSLKNGGISAPKSGRKVSFDPLALLLDASLEGEIDLVMKTAKEVENVSACNDEGITALHNAICAGHLDIVEFLVRFGADVNAPDSDGWTPLHCAASCNNLSMVKFLAENGACPLATTVSDLETAADKCEMDEDNFDSCSKYLIGLEEKLGTDRERKVYSGFDYVPVNEDEVELKVGGVYEVLRKGDEVETLWWWVKDCETNREGYAARNLLSLYKRPDPERDACPPFKLSASVLPPEYRGSPTTIDIGDEGLSRC